MPFWQVLLRSVAESFSTASSDVKIQIRQPIDGIWRDFSYVSGNVDSIRGGIDVASSAFPGAFVRAVNAKGRVIDFQ